MFDEAENYNSVEMENKYINSFRRGEICIYRFTLNSPISKF